MEVNFSTVAFAWIVLTVHEYAALAAAVPN
jgi:hypothetical protein